MSELVPPSLLEQLAELAAAEGVDIEELLALRYSTLERALLQYQWRGFRARPKQESPPGEWYVWLILAGRGFGKTRTGAEWLREEVESGRARQIALIGPTGTDVRSTMIEGPSGILEISPPWFKPRWWPGRGNGELEWPNGAIARCYSAEDSELRGPNLDTFWWDEPAKSKFLDALWKNVRFALRVRTTRRARGIFPGTPLPLSFFRDLMKRDDVVTTQGSTYENLNNLDEEFRKTVEEFDGTELGDQEVYGKILDENRGALFAPATIDLHRVRNPHDVPEFARVAIAVDPAVSTRDRSDETGIVVVGLGVDGLLYVLEDLGGKLTPEVWAKRAVDAYKRYRRRCLEVDIVAERNIGGDLVAAALRAVQDDNGKKEHDFVVKEVRTEESKEARAQPVSALYTQGRVRHVGNIPGLEVEQTRWVPGVSKRSPNRLDALCTAVHHLVLQKNSAPIAPLQGLAEVMNLGGAEPTADDLRAAPTSGWSDFDATFGPRDS